MTDIMFLYTKGFEIETDIKTGPIPTKFQSLDGKYAISSLFTATENHIIVHLNNKIEHPGLIYSTLRYQHIATEDNGVKKLFIPEQIFNVIADAGTSSLDKMLEDMAIIAFIAVYDHRFRLTGRKYLNPPPPPFPIKIKEKDSLMGLLLDWTDYYHNCYGHGDDDDYFQHWYTEEYSDETDNGYCGIVQRIESINGSYSTDIVKEPYFIIGETAVIHYATRMMGLLYRIPDFALNIINNNRILGSKYKEVFTEYNQKHDEFVRSIASFKEQHSQLMKKVI